jgi:glycosyltransferase involved in cell wall biosynthesis
MGGAERQWAALIPRLPERAVAVRLFCLDGSGRSRDELVRAGVAHASGTDAGSTRGLARSLLAECRNADVVVSWGFNAAAFGACSCRLTGTPHVVNWHSQPGLPIRRRQRAAIRLAAALGGRAIAVSPAQLDELESLGFRGGRVDVIPNGVPDTLVNGQARKHLRDELALPEDAVVALLVARLRPEKRIEDFIAAVELTRRSHPQVVGVVAGDGPLEARLRSRPGVGSSVHMLGYRSDVAELMQAADVFCLASSHEALPMTLIEAAAAARPLLATRTGGNSEVVVEGVTGLLVSPGDVAAFGEELGRLAGDAALRARLGTAARRRYLERFTLQAAADGYAAALRRIDGS